MNNEINKPPKVSTTESNKSTSASNNYSAANNNNTSTATLYPSVPSPLSLHSSGLQSYSTSSQIDVTVSAIAAAVNASSSLSVTTSPNAAAVVAVAVSSLAAAIILDTPIVSIAGSTLSEITTTTTSTKTTPTPVPTSKEPDNTNNSNDNLKDNSNKNYKDKQYKACPSTVHSSSSSYSTSRASVKGIDPMSVANTSVTGALTNAKIIGGNAAETDKNVNSIKQTKGKCSSDSVKQSISCGTSVTKSDLSLSLTESKSLIATTSSSQTVVSNASVSINKIGDISVIPSKIISKKDLLSDSWEESRLKDWDDSKLKELLDEAYSYKNPRDKENKSKTFLQLLEKAENEDQSYPFCVTSRGSRNLTNSIAPTSYHHYQQNSHYHSYSNNQNRSHHRHKQGGSLQDLFEIGLHESQLDCDQTFGIGTKDNNQRLRRQNHNSRQKKYSSVSTRQREGGSLPSNVNATHQLSISGSAIVNDLTLMEHEIAFRMPGPNALTNTANTTNTTKSNKKEQRRNASKAATALTAVCSEAKANSSTCNVGTVAAINNKSNTNTTNPAYTASDSDFIIDMGEPIIDIQQQQKIIQCKAQDEVTQGHAFYECLANSDKRIPRANVIGSTKGATYFVPTTSHCYVDETVRFNVLERNDGANNCLNSSTIDATFLPLDENYKSCKSVLGSGGEKLPEMVGKSKPSTIYTKISSPVSGSAILTGTTSNISTITQRQLDENGNAVNEMCQNSSGSDSVLGTTIQINAISPAATNPSGSTLLNSCGNVSTSATVTLSPHTATTTVSTSATVTTTNTSAPSQAKAKAKKKSQQERNTKTVDVKSVAGYRGNDTVEELVKYIESSGEDKQAGSGSKSGDKRKERKKDKEKHQKLKKSNSLEELRSGAKMEVHELKRTAATTENNAVLVRQKNVKQNKNNSYSTADINKNFVGKSSSQIMNSRKSDRKSWGNEDLKYLEDEQITTLTNEDKSCVAITSLPTHTTTNSVRERKKIGVGSLVSKEEKEENRDKANEYNESNLENNITQATALKIEKFDKLEVAERLEKCDKQEKNESKLEKSEKRKKQDQQPNAVTVVDILAIESVLPETAEFHVVTKKKKPKKQKVINNLEETSVTFNRTHNFTMQKTSTFNQQQQQMTVRYRYYHHDNSSNGSVNTNSNSQNCHQSFSSQQHQPSNSYNANNVGAITLNHCSQQPNQLQQQQQQQQRQQHYSTESYKNNTDKSRRKSTSSVPPSEKSDSSDIDSVHSLPIESSKPNAVNLTSNTSMCSNKQQRIKNVKNSHSILGNTSIVNKSFNMPAPISYADIARTKKETDDATTDTTSASGILINNEISTESRTADALVVIDSLNTEDKVGALANAALTTTVATTSPNAPTKTYKIKKCQNKQDFPELSGTSAVFNDDKLPGANTNQKTITYSQSLTAVTSPTLNTISNHGQGSGGAIDGSSNCPSSVNESLSSSSLDPYAKVAPTDSQKCLSVPQHGNIPPLQHLQQVLQNSKGGENDLISSTNSSLPTAVTSVASLNSNNLDQQYPALEKTVKRYSSVNAAMIGSAGNASHAIHAPFNFAAAAKQQIGAHLADMQNTNSNKNSALTTSNTNINNAIQSTLLPGSNFGSATSNITANKKSKERNLSVTSTVNLTTTTEQISIGSSSAFNDNVSATSVVAGTSLTNPKKSKKERQQPHTQPRLQLPHSSVDSSLSKPNQTFTTNAASNRKLIKTQLKISSSLPAGLPSSANSTNKTSANRPAVIILNDDPNSGSYADNQFTFGDFNEEELKLFNDNPDTAVSHNRINNINNTTNQSREEEKNQRTANIATAMKSFPTTYFNESATSCGNDAVINLTSDMLLSSSIDASSPNTSFVINSSGNNGTGSLPVPALNNNQSSDSGIYTDKTKSSNSSCSSSCSGGDCSKQNQCQQTTPNKLDDNKLNTFLSNSVHTSMDNLDASPQPPPPQQLETCNDIETAIIAAARAAAKEQKPPLNRHQQQQYKNSNTSSNSSSFSSSSLSSTSSAYIDPNSHPHHHHHHHHQHHQLKQHQHQHYNTNFSNNKNFQNNIGRDGNIISYQSHNLPDENYDDDHDDNPPSNTPHSCSPSRPKRISIAGGTVVNKELDIHYIPPTAMPITFTTQQHNDIIIDFIGSAWEEVANSKVTKVYDGQ